VLTDSSSLELKSQFFCGKGECYKIKLYNIMYGIFISESKAVMPCHAGIKGGGEIRSYSFSISALHGSEWSASCPGHALPTGEGTLVPIG
jgi:hypothetical protein